MTIEVLDEKTINKIAAGEVVERPASVIKELVENSMDAGATRIEVEIMAGGTSFMRVTDNGCGMSQKDAKAALMRHATSKLRTVEDLAEISTLGFRGEALPTIASVTRFSMLTRKAEEEIGTKVTVVGNDEKFSAVGCAVGTTIKAEDLFFNTPARKKFLKTTHTEGGKIGDFLMKLALSRPDIAFRFIGNNKLIMTTPGTGKLFDAIKSIYGSETADALLKIEFADEDIKIGGYISKPSTIKSNRSWQSIIVNGRIIKSYALTKAIDNAYRAKVPKVGYPFAAVIITVPQSTIDINVHPQKTEIKFDDENRIFKAVYKAVTDAITMTEKTIGAVSAYSENSERHLDTRPQNFARNNDYKENATGFIYTDELIKEKPLADFAATREELRNTDPPPMKMSMGDTVSDLADKFAAQPAPQEADFSDAPKENQREEHLKFTGGVFPIGQVDKCYIIAQDLTGLYIIDQHAAHERILFDKFSAWAERIPAQQLLVHQLLTFDERESRLVEDNLPLFHKLGFSLLAGGRHEFRLTEIPADMLVGDARDVITEILTKLRAVKDVQADDIRFAALASMACRRAIKSGEELNLRQMQIILEELARTKYPFTCPHGRPTVLKFSRDELAKMFKRTGF